MSGTAPSSDAEEIRFREQFSGPPAGSRRDTAEAGLWGMGAIAPTVLMAVFGGRQTALTAVVAETLLVGLVLLLNHLRRDVHHELVANGHGPGIGHGRHSAHVPRKDIECAGVLRGARGTTVFESWLRSGIYGEVVSGSPPVAYSGGEDGSR